MNIFFFLRKKTVKKNFSEKPLTETAEETAEGPGMGYISILFTTHSLINFDPGSEILGVPASEIKDTTFSDFNIAKIFDKFFFSLNL